MRVITGEFRGRKIIAPEGLQTRPTTDYMRQALFNILGDSIVDALVLDLYAGTGAVGIEALSRGAEHVTFVEKNRKVLSILRKNLDTINVSPKRYTVLEADAASFRHGQGNWHLVFADPPYEIQCYPLAPLVGLLRSTGSLLVIEHRAKNPPNDTGLPIQRVDYREYGQSAFSFYQFAQHE